jgi:cyclopropane fatty-acyl-phospholipid synthase-like methyltransferase
MELHELCPSMTSDNSREIRLPTDPMRSTKEQWDEVQPLLDELVSAGMLDHIKHVPKYQDSYYTYNLNENGVLAVFDSAFALS